MSIQLFIAGQLAVFSSVLNAQTVESYQELYTQQSNASSAALEIGDTSFGDSTDVERAHDRIRHSCGYSLVNH